MTSTDMVVREGSNVTMVCRATGYPEPYVMWRREDGQEFNCNGESGTRSCFRYLKHNFLLELSVLMNELYFLYTRSSIDIKTIRIEKN